MCITQVPVKTGSATLRGSTVPVRWEVKVKDRKKITDLLSFYFMVWDLQGTFYQRERFPLNGIQTKLSSFSLLEL